MSSMNNFDSLDQEFINSVKHHYNTSGRDLPWRNLSTELRQRVYEVIVSEMMLQQTQVARVTTKYNEWMRALPTMRTASNSELRIILKLWSGLGYNRRAKYLHELLKIMDKRPDSELCNGLESFSGIGPNTAGAIRAYALNMPSSYIETNIRSAILYHYFSDTSDKISDKQILAIVTRTVDLDNPREWYWALMDYGTMLKKTIKNNMQSSTYRKQSRFDGSLRQLRGRILKIITEQPSSIEDIHEYLQDERLLEALESLCVEKLIALSDKKYRIYEGGGVH